MEKNTLTWDEVLAAPGVERIKDAERHLDGWLVRYESPFFRAVVAAVELGIVHGHGGHGTPCYLYYTAEKASSGEKQENWYPVWWRPGRSPNLADFDHPAVAGSDPEWWASGVNADGVFVPECSGNCPELGEYQGDEWVQTRTCQVGRGDCRGLALGHTTASGRLEWTVAQDSVTIQVYRPIPEGTFSPELRDEVRAYPSAYDSAEDIPPQFRTPWTAVAEAMRHVPALMVAEITIPLKAPYDFRIWVPHHADGARPRHIDALMAAVSTVIGVIGYEFPGGSPGDALGTLWDWFGAGYGPDGEADETPVGVQLTQDPDWPRDPGELLGVAVYGDPDAPTVVE